MKAPQLELAYGFFCEFIRLEATGQITPVGIWGDTCRLSGNPPAILPTLAFHAFLRGVGKAPHKFKLKVTFPGNFNPLEVEVPLVVGDGQTTQNLNFNMAGINILGVGEIVAKVQIDTAPPIEREFRLKVEFQPLPLAAPIN